VTHSTGGHRFDIPIELRNPEEIVEIELDAKHEVLVQLMDRSSPQQGLRCRLYDHAGVNAVPGVTSDEDGLARWDGFAAGRYRIRVYHQDYWPAEAVVDAPSSGVATPVQVRRLGGLEIAVRDSMGRAVNDLEVSVLSLEFGSHAADWLARKLIESSTSNGRTDSNGRLALTGLPNGDYEWSLVAGGEQVGGIVNVPATEVAVVPVQLR
jgi:hypothetical protein